MQTVQFRCGHCGNLMAVGTENLGQQVRCPHPDCQQVVLAPAPAPPEPPAPAPSDLSFQLASVDENESIFAPTEAAADDLFGAAPAPRLEMPPGPQAQPGLPPTPVEQPAPDPTPPGLFETTFPSISPSDGPAVPLPPMDATAIQAPDPAALPALEGPPPNGQADAWPQPRLKRREAQGGVLTFIFMLSLISYAILATVVILILYLNRPQPYPLLEGIPDTEGDSPTGRKEIRPIKDEVIAQLDKMDVPDRLRVGLGQTLTLGDLEVTPLRLERKKVRVIVEGKDPEPCRHDSLVLSLRLSNVSANHTFTPLDNYFDRYYRTSMHGNPPLTRLDVGPDRFYGGPAHWVPRVRSWKERKDREWIEDPWRRNFNDGLKPGEAIETTICTDGEDERVAVALDDYHGRLLWRVHLRRGMVQLRDRRAWATAVVGVSFTDQDYREARP
jgi:hypothetical protein